MPPQWGPQQQWAANPQPGPGRGGGKTKWILGGLVVALTIALAVVITVILVRPDNNSDNTPNDRAPVAASEFASANDTGPITIITEDPTCAAWIPITNTLSDSSRNGWLQRDPSVPASMWSSEQREQYQSMAQAMRNAADQTQPLIKKTTHRVIRQLYEQFIAYTHAYVDAVPTYTEHDNALARTVLSMTNILTDICQAISSGSAPARAPSVSESARPAPTGQPGDPANPQRFLTSPNPVCADWAAAADQFDADTADWRRKIDINIPAGQWSREQRAATDAVVPTMRESADKLEELGQRSGNPSLQDFAQLAAQYRRAYVQALPTHSRADLLLQRIGVIPVGMVRAACDAVRG